MFGNLTQAIPWQPTVPGFSKGSTDQLTQFSLAFGKGQATSISFYQKNYDGLAAPKKGDTGGTCGTPQQVHKDFLQRLGNLCKPCNRCSHYYRQCQMQR